jgi:hypothetical protein
MHVCKVLTAISYLGQSDEGKDGRRGQMAAMFPQQLVGGANDIANSGDPDRDMNPGPAVRKRRERR